MILLAIPKACMNHLGPYLEVCLGSRAKASTLNPFGTIWELRKTGGYPQESLGFVFSLSSSCSTSGGSLGFSLSTPKIPNLGPSILMHRV